MVRRSVLAKAGVRFEARVGEHLLVSAMERAIAKARVSVNVMRDLATVRGFVSGSAALPLLDLPWTPLFVAILFLLHPLLGGIALGGALVFVSGWRQRLPELAVLGATIIVVSVLPLVHGLTTPGVLYEANTVTGFAIAITVPAGLLAALAAIGVAELVASASRAWESPVVSVGNRVVSIVSGIDPLKQLAIDLFGANDKIALLVGIGVLLAIYAAVLGLVARRRLMVGLIGISLFGVVGVISSLSDSGANAGFVLPSVVGTAAGLGALYLLLRPAKSTGTATRRGFVRNVGIVGVAGVATGGFGRVLAGRFSEAIEDARDELSLPTASEEVNQIGRASCRERV